MTEDEVREEEDQQEEKVEEDRGGSTIKEDPGEGGRSLIFIRCRTSSIGMESIYFRISVTMLVDLE